jgi:hypothetical protein
MLSHLRWRCSYGGGEGSSVSSPSLPAPAPRSFQTRHQVRTPSEFLVTNWMVGVLTLCIPEEAHFRSLHCVRVAIDPPRSWIFVEIEVK